MSLRVRHLALGSVLAAGGLGSLTVVGLPTQLGAQDDVSATTEGPLEVMSGEGQYWYTGRQLRTPIVFRLPDADEEECVNARAAFRPSASGTPSPDTVNGRWENGQCLFSSFWTLGSQVGRQHLKATLVGTPELSTDVSATAREGARVFFGMAYTPRQDSYTELSAAGDGTSEVRSVERRAVVRPIIGVDFPLWPTWERIRVSAATSAKEIDEFFYFGISGLQVAVFGHAQEASAIDLHVGLQLSRRDLGFQGAACDDQPFCTRRDLRVGGLALLLTIDSASAFKGLAGAVLR